MSNRILFVVSFIVAFVVFLAMNKYINYINEQSSFYILSSITQGLAALLAIILTATLIVVQVFKRFTAWKIAMSFETISLIIIYSASIILPLIFLRMDTQPWMLNVSISLMVLCIILLIPFLRHIATLFVNPIILGELEQNMIESIQQTAWGKVSNLIHDFCDSWVAVILSKNNSVMEEYINAWNNIVNQISHPERVHDSFSNTIMTTTMAAIRNKNEEYAIKIFSRYRISEVNIQKYYIPSKFQIMKLFENANKKNLMKLCTYLIRSLRANLQIFLRLVPQANKEQEQKRLLRDMLKINHQVVKDTLPKILGNTTEDMDFIKLMESLIV